jgi:hypothetical protein
VSDFRVWWALFVFFAVLSVLVLQQGYRRWRHLRGRREGWRLACMAASLLVMTALVFAGVTGAPRELLVPLQFLAVVFVAAVVVLSLRR